MKLRVLPGRIARRIQNHAFAIFGRDGISRAKVEPRPDLEEIGTANGGWVIPVILLDAGSICYCVGCGENISFDLGLIDRFKCDVHAFDPTPRAVEYVNRVAGRNGKYHFAKVGLWDKEETLKFYAPRNPEHVSHSLTNLQKTDDYINVPVKRLKQIMEEMGHVRLDLLKIDIEGAEYRVIDTIIEDNLDIRVICVEYDECFSPLDRGYMRRIRNSVRRLVEKGYSMACTRGNGNYTFVKHA